MAALPKPHAASPVLAWLATHAATRPAEVACSDGVATVTWAALAARVDADAARLRDAGIGPGARVGVALPNGTAFVETFLAVLAAGAAVFPWSVAAPPAEITRVLARTPVSALVAADLDAARRLAPPGVVAVGTGVAGLVCTGRARAVNADGHDAALVAWSPGTTAGPYLVRRTHAQLAAEAASVGAAARLDPDDVILGLVPLSHAYGLGVSLLAGIHAGARLVLRPRFARRETLDLLAEERVTVAPLVPFMAHMLTTVARAHPVDLGSVRLALTAGAALPRATWDAFQRAFRIPLRQLYGLTEAGAVTLNAAPATALDPASAGTPLPGVDVTVEDGDGRAVDTGVEGEVVVRSPAAARGAERPLRTGDRGRITSGGELVLTGRTSRFLNHAGNKVDPAEVEAVLRLHPAVRAARVVGEPDALVEEIVVARVVPSGTVRAEELRAHCRTHLAGYKVPRVLRLVAALPPVNHV